MKKTRSKKVIPSYVFVKIEGHKHVHRCIGCGKRFVTRHSAKRYCDECLGKKEKSERAGKKKASKKTKKKITKKAVKKKTKKKTTKKATKKTGKKAKKAPRKLPTKPKQRKKR